MSSNRQRYTLRSHERLKLRKEIETLFSKGEAFSVYPVKIIFLLKAKTPGIAGIKAGFSVPKKKFRRAHDRNLIRRRLREAWRLHKHLLLPALPEASQLHCFAIFLDKEIPPYAQVEKAIQQAVAGLIKRIMSSEHR